MVGTEGEVARRTRLILQPATEPKEQGCRVPRKDGGSETKSEEVEREGETSTPEDGLRYGHEDRPRPPKLGC